ncbi:MAG: hypothetical protein NZ869_07835 [Thermoanaerobaculum sp.]|nr:hypothetical protein [Thermoanaerobaculum sp.]
MHVLKNIRIPRFDPSSSVHRRLAEFSQAAHEAAGQGETPRLQQLETEIDQQAAQMWGLSEIQLREIQASLRKGGGEPGPVEAEEG